MYLINLLLAYFLFRSPSSETTSYPGPSTSVSPGRPQSPRAARKPVNPDDNTAPRSPRPGTPGSRSGKSDQSDGSGKKYSPGSASRSYLSHQSDLIKPVSVKLENCMLMSEKSKIMEGKESFWYELINPAVSPGFHRWSDRNGTDTEKQCNRVLDAFWNHFIVSTLYLGTDNCVPFNIT